MSKKCLCAGFNVTERLFMAPQPGSCQVSFETAEKKDLFQTSAVLWNKAAFYLHTPDRKKMLFKNIVFKL